jgi:hypothetical protein
MISHAGARRMALSHGALACDQCPRKGQYRKETLIARFGSDVLMPDGPKLESIAAIGEEQPATLA